MLHIFLAILKIIGILLAVLLGIICFLVLCLLFCPVRYKVRFHYDKVPSGSGRVRFLGPAIWLSMCYDEELTATFRVLGIPLWRYGKHSDEPKTITDVSESRELSEAESIGKDVSSDISGEDNKRNRKSTKPKKESWRIRVKQWFQKLKSTRTAVKGFFERLNDLRQDEQVRVGFAKCKFELFRFLKRIRPKHLKGLLEVGFDDPSVTGEVLGVLAVLRGIWDADVAVNPDFEQKVLRADVTVSGHVRGYYLLQPAWKLFMDKDIKYLLNKGKGLRRS